LRKILYAAILVTLIFAPVNRQEVRKLLPIRAVAVYRSQGQITLETDTEHKGQGKSVEAAIMELKKNTPAVVYLDTAEFLLVSKDAEEVIPQLANYFKPRVKVCICDAEGDVETAAEYADVHGTITELRHWRTK